MKKRPQMPFLAFMLLMTVIVALLVVIWSIKRKPDPKFRVTLPGTVEELGISMAGVTHGELEEGNRIEILQNGDYFGALFRDIAAARQTVHFETFLWHEGAIGDQLASLFAQAARRGVEVRVLLDASGTRPMRNELKEMMSAAGCKVETFHSPSFADLGRINNRTHRKIAVIDGRIGYVGGHCIAPEWTGQARNKKENRDTSVRVQGPVVNSIQSAFSENWVEETGEVTIGEKYFPKLQPVGTSKAHLAYLTPQGNVSAVEVLYYLAIISSRSRLVVQNPYFLPDPEAVKALGEAVKRGVDVEVMLPSVEVTDSAIVQHASHHRFGALLAAGVKIYEYERSLLHQKVLIVDRRWACIGSTNFDDRSFEINDEVSLSVLDPAVAAGLEEAWKNDLGQARQRHLAEWNDRGSWHKLVDAVAYVLNEQL